MSDLQFQKLTPTCDVDLTAYEEGFEFIFNNDDIRNVAISGPYSSGKSSLLESYKQKHTNKNFIHISLAHFSEDNLKDTSNEETVQTANESIIEGKILNQLIQQIPIEKIPQSNFRIKRTSGINNNHYWAMGIVGFISMLFFIFNYGNYCSWISGTTQEQWKYSWLKNFLTFWSTPLGLTLCVCITIAIACLGLYHLLNIQSNKSLFKKISVQGNEIEIFEDTQNSYFDKYLNEVLYLFENSSADVIVFEDIDRFENVQIFERLREINMLTNCRLQQREEEEHVLRFFYLLRDDIFITKDRAKFFDYILPVVPVLDSSNSYNKIKEFFASASMSERLDDRFLKGLALYIDDLRVLKNIYNEFVIYYERLKKINLDPNKMLALITYKNLFPKDFSDLQLNRGFVYTIFNHREEFIAQTLESIESEIENLNQRIVKSKDELAVSLQELKDIRKAKYERDDAQYYYNQKPFQEWEEKILAPRQQAVKDKSKDEQQLIANRLAELEIRKRRITGWSMSQIITRDNIDQIFHVEAVNELGEVTDYHEIKKSNYFDLLKYLIRNGFIDESYSDYMTYFYENSLTLNDKTFLRSVNDKRAKDPSYRIDSPILVLSDLVPADFHQEETLNFDLLDYMLGDVNSTYKNHLRALAVQFQEKDCYTFISKFFSLNRRRKEFVMWINEQWPGFWKEAFDGDKLTADQLQLYGVYSVAYSSSEILSKMNQDGELSRYISNNRDFLLPSECDTSRMVDELVALEVRFEFLNAKSDTLLLDGIYRNDLYILNEENISLFLDVEYRQAIDEVREHILTFIISVQEQPLYVYVRKNINHAVNLACDISKGQINDDEAVAIAIINDSDVVIDTKLSYISALNTVMSDIGKVLDSQCRDALLASRLICATASNIYEYFSRQSLSEVMIKFINETSNDLDFASTEYDKNIVSRFVDCVQLSNDITDYHYKSLISAKGKILTNFTTPNLSESKMCILLEESKIEMNISNLLFIRQNYPNMILRFIEQNLETYCKIINYQYVDQNELESILAWNILEFEEAIRLIDMLRTRLRTIGRNYNDRITAYILQNKFSEDEFIPLFESYNSYSQEVKHCILHLADSRMQELIDSIKKIEISAILDVLDSTEIEENSKVMLLNHIIRTYDTDDIRKCLIRAGFEEVSKLLDNNNRPRIVISDTTNQLMDALKIRKFISSYKPNETTGIYKYTRPSKRNHSLPMEIL